MTQSAEERVPIPCPDFHTALPGSEVWASGRLAASSDGSCPSQSALLELRRSTLGLNSGPDHPANCKEMVLDMNQKAQSGEVAGATRWAQCALCPSLLYTDSQYVNGNGNRILELGANGCKAPSHHSSLWWKFCAAVKAKGRRNFAIENVEWHVPWSQVANQDDEEQQKWLWIDAADKLAVVAAEESPFRNSCLARLTGSAR